MNKYTEFFGFKVISSSFIIRCLESGTSIINCLNAHAYNVTEREVEFKNAMMNSFIIADGVSISMTAKLMGRKVERITGWDAFTLLNSELNKSVNKKVFFLGSTEETLSLITRRFNHEYSNISVSSYSPPFSDNFSKEENNKIIEIIKRFDPDVIYVGMTAPKQELWVANNAEFFNNVTFVSVGAVFDFYAGKIKRAPQILRVLGMEWLHRSIVSPKRLGKRNLVSNPEFIVRLIWKFIYGR